MPISTGIAEFKLEIALFGSGEWGSVQIAALFPARGRMADGGGVGLCRAQPVLVHTSIDRSGTEIAAMNPIALAQ
jgi:hypothetical protein